MFYFVFFSALTIFHLHLRNAFYTSDMQSSYYAYVFVFGVSCHLQSAHRVAVCPTLFVLRCSCCCCCCYWDVVAALRCCWLSAFFAIYSVNSEKMLATLDIKFHVQNQKS